jgi:hypothetical protein
VGDRQVLEALNSLAVEPAQERQHHGVVEVERGLRDEIALTLQSEVVVCRSDRWPAPPAGRDTTVV